jgi:hypothetical protein
MKNLDKWLKRVWLLIGGMVLLVLIALIAIFIIDFVSGSGSGNNGIITDNAAQTGSRDSLVLQDITFQKPLQIGRTNLCWIGIRVKDLENPELLKRANLSASYKWEYNGHGYVNIIFTRIDGSGAYPFLDKKACINMTDIPTRFDSLQNFNLYDIAFKDSDNNDRINLSDSSHLYISDLNGLNLLKVIPDGYRLSWFEKSDNRRQIFLLTQRILTDPDIKPKDWPEKLFVYDVKTRALSPFPADENVIIRIKKILWDK